MTIHILHLPHQTPPNFDLNALSVLTSIPNASVLTSIPKSSIQVKDEYIGVMLLTWMHTWASGQACTRMHGSLRKDLEANLTHWNLMIEHSLWESTMLKLIYIIYNAQKWTLKWFDGFFCLCIAKWTAEKASSVFQCRIIICQ